MDMFERFTEKAIKVIMLAQAESRRLGHNFVGTEQILLVGAPRIQLTHTSNANPASKASARPPCSAATAVLPYLRFRHIDSALVRPNFRYGDLAPVK
jgi:hypothetical protein